MSLLTAIVVFLIAVACYDVVQRKHSILHNFPVIGHFRYLLELVGPELRQYIVTSNDEERPFDRDQRRWVYASSKKENNYFGFGTDNDLELSPNYLIIKHKTVAPMGPTLSEEDPSYPILCAKVLGESRKRKKAFRPTSVVNISGMSYGSLGATATEAINKGAAIADCLHNTGEGGISDHHQHGAKLIWQIGTGYFGCRNSDGSFSRSRFLEQVEQHDVAAVEIKLSQGAKPGRGGVLPGAKVTEEISRVRGIPPGKDCISPDRHSAFSDISEMLDFIEDLAQSSGVPVGIKSAVGDTEFWVELAKKIVDTDRAPDFVCIDGGEGGTGAAPLVFADHVALPFKIGFNRVFQIFAQHNLDRDIVFIGSGKLGFPQEALLAFGLGCDMIAVGREAMLAIGCIQAQRCHTAHCPAGVATHNSWLMAGLDPTLKSARLANYIVTLRKELSWLCKACGVDHPSKIGLQHFEILDDCLSGRPAEQVFREKGGSESTRHLA